MAIAKINTKDYDKVLKKITNMHEDFLRGGKTYWKFSDLKNKVRNLRYEYKHMSVEIAKLNYLVLQMQPQLVKDAVVEELDLEVEE